MKSVPCATDQRTISRARSKTSCSVRRRLQLAPDVDALDQRAGLVPARLPGGERRVEMEVAVDERRRDEARLRVDLLRAVGGDRLADARPASVLGEEVDEPPVEQAGVAHDEAHARESTGRGTAARACRAARTGRSPRSSGGPCGRFGRCSRKLTAKMPGPRAAACARRGCARSRSRGHPPGKAATPRPVSAHRAVAQPRHGEARDEARRGEARRDVARVAERAGHEEPKLRRRRGGACAARRPGRRSCRPAARPAARRSCSGAAGRQIFPSVE